MADSNHTSGTAVVSVTVTFTCLACIVTALRLYTRIFLVKSSIGLDDFFILAAATCSIAVTATMCEQVQYGMGRHWDSLSNNDKMMATIWFWASVWIYYGALCMAKVSILLQYLRVFPSTKFRIVTFTLMAIVVIYSMGTMLSAMFICTPVRRFWDRSVEGSCLNEPAVWFSNTILNIMTDIATTVLPLPVLRTLQLPKRQKYLLMMVFGLGFLTCIISILRLHSLYVVSNTTDLSWDNPMPAVWSSTELNVGIICSCLPTLKGMVSRIWPKLLSSGHTGQRSGSRSLNLAHLSSGNSRHAQQQWEEELKSPRYDRLSRHLSPPDARQTPTFLETDSERSVPAANRIRVPMDSASQKNGKTSRAGWEERDSTPTLTRGEDMQYMLRDPTYKV